MGGCAWEWKGTSGTGSAAQHVLNSLRNQPGAWVCARAGSSPTAVPGPLSYVSTVCFAPWAGLLTTSRNTVTSDIPSFAIHFF